MLRTVALVPPMDPTHLNSCAAAQCMPRVLIPADLPRWAAGLLLLKPGSPSETTVAGKLLSEMVGSSFYIAPEVLRGKYSAKVDLWSAGVIVYIMLSGLPPFWGPNTRECFNNILTAAPTLEGDLWDSVSELGKNFIRGCDAPAELARLPWGF